jgi:hypothetical protein
MVGAFSCVVAVCMYACYVCMYVCMYVHIASADGVLSMLKETPQHGRHLSEYACISSST